MHIRFVCRYEHKIMILLIILIKLYKRTGDRIKSDLNIFPLIILIYSFNITSLLSSKSQLTDSTENKLLLYNAILKPIWAYGIQLWGTASNSNIEILQRFQNKILRIIM